jgi:hypothetical protein
MQLRQNPAVPLSGDIHANGPGKPKRSGSLLACPESVERFQRPEKKLLFRCDFSALPGRLRGALECLGRPGAETLTRRYW